MRKCQNWPLCSCIAGPGYVVNGVCDDKAVHEQREAARAARDNPALAAAYAEVMDVRRQPPLVRK